MQSFGGKGGIWKEHVEKGSLECWQATATNLIIKRRFFHLCVCMLMCVYVWICGSSVHRSLQQNTRVGCHVLLQGIFPTQGRNPDLPHCRQILYQLSHMGSPRILEVGGLSLLQGLFLTQESN